MSSVIKAFATSGSIILSCLVSAMILKDCSLGYDFFVGAAVVCASTIAYAAYPAKAPAETLPGTQASEIVSDSHEPGSNSQSENGHQKEQQQQQGKDPSIVNTSYETQPRKETDSLIGEYAVPSAESSRSRGEESTSTG